MALPSEWDDTSRAWQLVTIAAGQLDAACRAGDVDQFRVLTTARYVDEVAGLLARDGRKLDGDTLRQQRAHVGDIVRAPLLAGVASEDAAVAVVARDRTGFEHDARARGVLGLRFAWDGFALRLDGKTWRAVPPGVSVDAAARELARTLLAEQR